MTSGAVQLLTDGGRIHSRYPRWGRDGSTLYFLSDRSGYDEIWCLDLATGRQQQVTRSAGQDKEGEFAVAPDGIQLAYRQRRHTCQDLEIMRPGGAPRRLNTFDGVCVWPDWSPDGRLIAVHCEGPHMLPELRVLATDTGTEVAHTSCSPAPETRATMQMVSFTTFDDRQLDGVLYTDDATLTTPRPAILHVHGGPNAQETFNYDPYLQALAREGFVILLPNSRGSTGYGRAFMDLNLKDWGGQDLRADTEQLRCGGSRPRRDRREAECRGDANRGRGTSPRRGPGEGTRRGAPAPGSVVLTMEDAPERCANTAGGPRRGWRRGSCQGASRCNRFGSWTSRLEFLIPRTCV